MPRKKEQQDLAIRERAAEIKPSLVDISDDALNNEAILIARDKLGQLRGNKPKNRVSDPDVLFEATARLNAILTTLEDRQEAAIAQVKVSQDFSQLDLRALEKAREAVGVVEPVRNWTSARVQFTVYEPQDYPKVATLRLIAARQREILERDYEEGYAKALKEIKALGSADLQQANHYRGAACASNYDRYGSERLVGYGQGYYNAYLKAIDAASIKQHADGLAAKEQKISQFVMPLIQILDAAGVPAEVRQKVQNACRPSTCTVVCNAAAPEGVLKIYPHYVAGMLKSVGLQYAATVRDALVQRGALTNADAQELPPSLFQQPMVDRIGMGEGASLGLPSSRVAQILAREDARYELDDAGMGDSADPDTSAKGTGWTRFSHRDASVNSRG